MQELQNKPKSTAQQAFDNLPFWMRQMMQDKVEKCLVADANEQKQTMEIAAPPSHGFIDKAKL